MRHAICIFTVALALTPISSHAQPVASGPYASLYAGASFLESADNTGAPFVAGAPNVDIKSEFGTGFVVGGTAGYGWGMGSWRSRLELDLAYRRSGLDSLTIDSDGGLGGLAGVGPLNGQSTSDVDGSVGTFSSFVNGWIDIGPFNVVTPYVGGGIGFADVSLKSVEVSGFEIVDDSDLVFAWQIGAGVAWNITPSLAATADYRWFNTGGPSFEFSPTGNDFDSEYSSHNVMAGLRFGF